MASARKVQLPWTEIDTLLLDMDGTLLDLAFDNFFWLELVPRRFAERERLGVSAAREIIERRYADVVGTLPWYCVDHWTAELGLDIRGLKSDHRHLIRYLPRAPEFLEAARACNKRLILVTNAHPATLAIKLGVTAIDRWMDAVVSSHELHAPKEHADFWHALIDVVGVDPGKCALFDDSQSVLGAARAFGVGHTIAVRCPDSRLGPRKVERFESVDAVGDLVEELDRFDAASRD